MAFDSLRLDAHSAWRSLRHQPMSAAAAIGMLGLAIGITAAMFTIVDALILRPVPFSAPDELAALRMTGRNGGQSTTRPTVFVAWREARAFTAIEAARPSEAVVRTENGDLVRSITDVTPGIFTMLGNIRPVRGRMFDAADGLPGTDDRVLISEGLWRAGYRADPMLVGRTISIDNKPVTVVGILPAKFRFPEWNTELWRAASFDDPSSGPNLWPLVYVRFAPNVPRSDALKLATIVAIQAGALPDTWATSVPLGAASPDEYYARAVPLLSAGAALLFVVLCANVSSILLAGLASRRRDVATRAALGAPRWRLIRQSFIEAGAIGIGGTAAGIAIAWELVSIGRATLPPIHSLNPLNLGWRAFAVTSAAGLFATLFAGIVPGVVGTRVDPYQSLHVAGRSDTETRRARIATRVLLASQIALSCMLLIGATGLVRSFVNLMTADRGIDTRNIIVAWVAMTGRAFESPEARDAAARTLEEQARALPGVTHAAWSYGTPPRGAIGLGQDWTADGGERVSLDVTQSIVGAQFFDLYGIPIVRGRSFQASDGLDAVLVSERLAQALWPDADAVGRSVSLDNANASPRRRLTFRIIGVVRDTHFPSLKRNQDLPQLYTQYRSTIYTPMLSLRCNGPCPESGLVRRRLSEAAPGVRVQAVDLLDDVYAAQFARPRASALLAFVFAGAALIAAASGLFSLLSFSVARRRREFGIRSALGASPSAVRSLVWQDGLTVIVTGISAGTIAAVFISRFFAALFYEVTIADPLSWGIVAGVLAASIAAASWPPARSAALANPVTLLREE